jgi:hypothetical protein
MTKFAMIFHFYCHTYPSHFSRKKRLFFVELFSSLYPRTRYSWKQQRNNPSTCHHRQDRFTLQRVEIAMKLHRNRDEKPCQSKKLYDVDNICATQKRGKLRRKRVAILTKKFGREKTYDANAICVTQNRGKVQRNFVAIATKILVKLKPNHYLVTNFRRYCHASCRFKNKIT